MGAAIVATDLGKNDDWAASGEKANSIQNVYWPSLIREEDFNARVSFRQLDMRELQPLSGNKFDFIWSSCSLEHLGSLENGLRFIEDSAQLLNKGGIAVHTTEFNVSSDEETMQTEGCVIYRKRDIEALSARLQSQEFRLLNPDFNSGTQDFDVLPDVAPYYSTGRQHVKLMLGGYVATSILLIIERASP